MIISRLRLNINEILGFRGVTRRKKKSYACK